MSNTVPATPTEATEADPNAPIYHFCIIIYVKDFGFQMHPLGEQVTPEGPSMLLCNRPYQRTMDPVFLASAMHWSLSTVTMAPEIHERGFFGEAYFIHNEHGLVILAAPWWVDLTEKQQEDIRALPLLTVS